MYLLDDFACFHAVVFYQSFTLAARQLGMPKGTLSKRISRLEARLEVRLLERSTRRLRPTDVGQAVFEQCSIMVDGYQAAEAAAANSRLEPNGLVRLSCPQGLIQDLVGPMLREFLRRYPKVRVHLKEFNRPADLIHDAVDLALRARVVVGAEAGSVVRRLGLSRRILVASPEFVRELNGGPQIEDLGGYPLLATVEEEQWRLVGPGGNVHRVTLQPRLSCSDFDVLNRAAMDGLGIALLPDHICNDSIRSGALQWLLPQWHTGDATVYAVFSTRHGMKPALRALVDYLADQFHQRDDRNLDNGSGLN